MMRNFYISVFFIGIFGFPGLGVTAQVPASQDTLTLGIAGSSPFVVDTLLQTGISLEVWQELAGEAGIPYRTRVFEDVPHALAALKQGVVDGVVGPVSITSDRAETARFTQPYYQSSLSILSISNPPNFWQRLAPFFSKKFFVAVCIFLLILGVVGTLLWLAERKENPDQFPHTPARGVANGMWCAIVTMTTTGYGDISPTTFWGRFIAGSWMIISLVLATTMIAGIASTLTLTGMQTTKVSTAEELAGKRIGVVSGSPAMEFARQYGGRTANIRNIDDGFSRLKAGEIDAIVYDRPQLLYYVSQHAGSSAVVSVAEYERQGYGFAFPLSSNLHDLNVELLELQESGAVEEIVNKWLREK